MRKMTRNSKATNDVNQRFDSSDKQEKYKTQSEDPIKSMNFFKRLKLVKGTLSKLRERTSFRKFGFVKNHQLKIIHDYTFDEEGRKDDDNLISLKAKKKRKGIYFITNYLERLCGCLKNLGHLILDKLEEFLQKTIPTIKPNSKTKILWDFCIMFFVLFKFFMIPIELCFGIKLHINVDPIFGLVNFLTSCFFIMDIFLKMNTGFYENGNIVLIKSKILTHYFKSYFILDILASVHSCKYIYEYIYTLTSQSVVSSAPWLHIFFFFKLIELMHIVSNLEESVYMSETVEALTELLKLVVKIVFYSHLEACVWHATAHFNKFSGENWIENAKMSDAHWFDRYLVSLFWSVSSLITASYGEKVSPQNRLEMIIGVFLLLAGAMVFGYTIKSVGELLDRLNSSKRAFKVKLRTLNRFMKKKKINYELQDRARKYLHFFLKDRESENSKKVEQILDKFSFHLKEEIYLNTYGVILQKFPILKSNFSNDFLKKLVFQMTHVSFIPEEIIFGEHNPEDQNLYLITEGFIQLYHDNSKRITLLKKMTINLNLLFQKAGDSFGEKEFFTGSTRSYSAKSITFSSGYCIKREQFISTMQKFPDDYERFCMIKDEILIYNETSSLKQKCFSCNMISHDYTQCRKIKYIPFKDFVIRRSQYSKTQNRDTNFKRKTVKKFNSRYNNKAVVSQVHEFLVNASYLYSETLTLSENDELGGKTEEFGNETFIDHGKVLPGEGYKIGTENSINSESSIGTNIKKIKIKCPKSLEDLSIKKSGKLKKKISEVEKKDDPFSSISDRSYREDRKHENKKIDDRFLGKPLIISNFNQNEQVHPFKHELLERIKNSKLRVLEKALSLNENITSNNDWKKIANQREKKYALNNYWNNDPRTNKKTSSYINHGAETTPLSSIKITHKEETHKTTDYRNRTNSKTKLDDCLFKLDLFLLDFDRVKTYSKYFYNNNLENVIKEIKTKERLLKKKKLKLRISQRSFRNMEDSSPGVLIKVKRGKSRLLSNESIKTSKKEKIRVYEVMNEFNLDKDEGLQS